MQKVAEDDKSQKGMLPFLKGEKVRRQKAFISRVDSIALDKNLKGLIDGPSGKDGSLINPKYILNLEKESFLGPFSKGRGRENVFS